MTINIVFRYASRSESRNKEPCDTHRSRQELSGGSLKGQGSLAISVNTLSGFKLLGSIKAATILPFGRREYRTIGATLSALLCKYAKFPQLLRYSNTPLHSFNAKSQVATRGLSLALEVAPSLVSTVLPSKEAAHCIILHTNVE